MMTVDEWKKIFANNTIDSVNYKDTALEKVTCNGTIVWESLKSVTISGTAKSGQALTATITPSTANVTYQWCRNGSNISGATNKTYTLTNSDVGTSITCKASTSTKTVTSNAISGIDYNWIYNSGTTADLSTSSGSDWFETNKYTPSSPIIPKTVYCYFSYNYYSKDDGSRDTSCGGGLLYTCADGTGSGTSGAPGAGVGTYVAGRPSSGTYSKTTTFTDTEIAWFKQHGGLTQIWYNGGGGTTHGTQSCGGHITGYYYHN